MVTACCWSGFMECWWQERTQSKACTRGWWRSHAQTWQVSPANPAVLCILPVTVSSVTPYKHQVKLHLCCICSALLPVWYCLWDWAPEVRRCMTSCFLILILQSASGRRPTQRPALPKCALQCDPHCEWHKNARVSVHIRTKQHWFVHDMTCLHIHTLNILWLFWIWFTELVFIVRFREQCGCKLLKSLVFVNVNACREHGLQLSHCTVSVYTKGFVDTSQLIMTAWHPITCPV